MKMAPVGLLALAALVLAAPAHAALTDDFAMTDGNAVKLVRIANGDIPTTTGTEAAGRWNAVEYLTGTTSTYTLPPGAAFDGFECACATFTTATAGNEYSITANGTAAKTAFHYHYGNAGQQGFTVQAPSTGPAQVVAYLVTDGTSFVMTGTVAVAQLPHPSIQGLTINDATVPTGQAATFIIAQATTTHAKAPINWLYLAAAALAGMILWSLLVSKGLVQSRSRKQIAQTAAHVEVAKKEPKAVLEGKKRALLAALKEVELARQSNEMDVPVYDAVKAELKKEAVTVMRAIEEAGE
jgi:hypothetical protein